MQIDRLNRRRLVTFLGAVIAWPQIARAEQPKDLPLIGFLPLSSPSNRYDASYVQAFRDGLTENGLIEGRNISVEVVWVAKETDYDDAVLDLMRRGANVLAPAGSTASAAAKRQTSTIPIVFVSVGNPVGIKIVENLAHPGGNATGFTDVLAELSSKLVELAKTLSKAGAPVGYVWFDKWPDGFRRLMASEQAATAVALALRPRAISDISELDALVAELKSNRMMIDIVQPSPFTYRHRKQIIEALTNNGLGMVCAWPPAPAEGALVGYGPDYADIYRRAGTYISRVLKGENPAELPVQNPTKFKLVISQSSRPRNSDPSPGYGGRGDRIGGG
jgi:putative tryptophan/tyrosine transport system substrate-binding protein